MSHNLSKTSRRSFTRRVTASTILATTQLNRRGWSSPVQATSQPSLTVGPIRTISQSPELYCGWPTLTRRSNGQLILVWSGGREHHVCPFGRVDMMRSDDGGETWSWPRTLLDGAIDDRDAGVIETAKGSLLVTTFTSLAYQRELDRQIAWSNKEQQQKGRWSEAKLARWRAVHDRISEEQRQAELGQWMIRSTDGGVTWSKRYGCIVNSPHGPTQLSDGRLVYAGKELWTGERSVGVCESLDDGETWRWLAKIPERDGDRKENYHELHAVEAPSGRLIVHIRNHNKPNDRETLQSESDDGGKTWTKPHSIGVWGLPSFLSKLSDGRLLMTYGHRRQPLGIQARTSSDEGRSWSDPLIIWGEGSSGDLGYPSTVELDDGSLLTVWYEKTPESSQAVLRQAKWKIDG